MWPSTLLHSHPRQDPSAGGGPAQYTLENANMSSHARCLSVSGYKWLTVDSIAFHS